MILPPVLVPKWDFLIENCSNPSLFYLHTLNVSKEAIFTVMIDKTDSLAFVFGINSWNSWPPFWARNGVIVTTKWPPTCHYTMYTIRLCDFYSENILNMPGVWISCFLKLKYNFREFRGHPGDRGFYPPQMSHFQKLIVENNSG